MTTFTQSELNKVRIGIPSKGRMLDQTLEFLEECGLKVRRNRREYLATLENFPELQVVFQRQEDIVRGVENGMLSFGIAGFDLFNEIPVNRKELTIVHDNLDFGYCTLEVAIPEIWRASTMEDINGDKKYKVATKFPKLTAEFLDRQGLDYEFAEGAGTLEVSPALGNADFIVDLVSTGRTLEDNRLKRVQGGQILSSQAVLIGNREQMKDTTILEIAKRLIEYFSAMLRAKQYVSLYANIRGDPDEIVSQLRGMPGLEGLQGPTVSRVITTDSEEWFAIHVIVSKKNLAQTVSNLRSVGGSGVVVTPTSYIFEEEPEQYLRLLANLGGE